MLRFISSVALAVSMAACGSAPAGSGARQPDAEDTQAPVVLPPVQAGSYRLRLSATCQNRELTATGVLTLEPIAGSEVTAADEASDSVLLWGQADLDLEQLSKCLGGKAVASSEPIHPSVLVEVLKWDGEPHHPVLLVSTEGRRQGKVRLAGVGIAMWVERVDRGYMGGVWSRWEVMGHEEGRWEAELVTPL